jgi:hypothetical protein
MLTSQWLPMAKCGSRSLADQHISGRLSESSLSLAVFKFLTIYRQRPNHIFLLTMAYKRPKQKGTEDLHATTIARIQQLQSQIATAPRGIRLKDKVCIITGVGSTKGIGYAHPRACDETVFTRLLDVHLLSALPTKVCE